MTLEREIRPSFAHLAGQGCPPLDQILFALERELELGWEGDTAEALDELALPLFDRSRTHRLGPVVDLGKVAWDALPEDETRTGAWFLSPALREGIAAGPLRAALAVEVGRRAGISTRIARGKGCWVVYGPEKDGFVAVEMGVDRVPPAPGEGLAAVCPHELAACLLSGAISASLDEGRLTEAHHASRLRALLR